MDIPIPKKFSCAGFAYDVKTSDEVLLYGREVGGKVSFREGELVLSTKGKRHNIELALIHEIVHVLNDSIESERLFFREEGEEENFVHVFTRALYAFIKDNVKTLEWKGAVIKDGEIDRSTTVKERADG